MAEKLIRLGVLGFAEGNGHPYSWSAICNGYEPEAMNGCGFPAIPAYLAKRQWPQDRLQGVAVTHVWTQDEGRSRHIAKAALIEKVVGKPLDMIGAVDGVLLARDDAENHPALATPFLKAGVPVYVDKAPALSIVEFDALCAAQARPGLLFTGTSLRYAREFNLDATARREIGDIRYIFGMTPKSWDRYAVHVIEPALIALGGIAAIDRFQRWESGGGRGMIVGFAGGVQAEFAALGDVSAPISMRIVGERGWRDLVFADAFSCFREGLAVFAAGVRAGQSRCDLDMMRRVVELLERGRA